MGRVIISTQLTVDGVQDRQDQWFDQHGEHDWHAPAGKAAHEQLLAAEALLLGRKNYEGFAAVWPTLTDDIGFADRVNSMPKYVASRSPIDNLTWNAQQLEGDLAPAVRALKKVTSGDLVSYGCGEFARQLVATGLVDEVRFWINPISMGPGARPFPESEPIQLRLVGTATFDTGIVLLRYAVVE
jgi:dihydrofolate reductase